MQNSNSCFPTEIPHYTVPGSRTQTPMYEVAQPTIPTCPTKPNNSTSDWRRNYCCTLFKKRRHLAGREGTYRIGGKGPRILNLHTRGLDWTYRLSRLPFVQYAREFRTLRDAGGFVVLKICLSTNNFGNF
jgi:hypothetical protein